MVTDCIQTYIRIFGLAPDISFVDCRQITALCEPYRTVEVSESQNIALVLCQEPLSRIRVSNSRLVSIYATVEALLEPLETHNSFSVAFFAVLDAPANATAEFARPPARSPSPATSCFRFPLAPRVRRRRAKGGTIRACLTPQRSDGRHSWQSVGGRTA